MGTSCHYYKEFWVNCKIMPKMRYWLKVANKILVLTCWQECKYLWRSLISHLQCRTLGSPGKFSYSSAMMCDCMVVPVVCVSMCAWWIIHARSRIRTLAHTHALRYVAICHVPYLFNILKADTSKMDEVIRTWASHLSVLRSSALQILSCSQYTYSKL